MTAHLAPAPHHVTVELPCPVCRAPTPARGAPVHVDVLGVHRRHRCGAGHAFQTIQHVRGGAADALRVEFDTPRLFVRLAALVLRLGGVVGAWRR